MNLLEAMEQRHSVRSYLDKPIEDSVLQELEKIVAECNKESGLHIQLVKNEPKAFDSIMAHYGKFSGVKNYIALIGKKSSELEELCGYYGEKIVIKAQTLGLNTCWVAMTYKKIPEAFSIDPDEKLTVVIPIGYGAVKGVPHKSKEPQAVSNYDSQSPEWFKKGIKYALLAPTAMNQQKFKFELQGNKVSAKAGTAFYSKMDLGIAKYHFEVGSGKDRSVWK